MKTAIATLRSISPYSQSRPVTSPKKDKEAADAYEERTWRERVHSDKHGNVLIPPMAFKNCVAECAKFLGRQIKGRGKSTYTKHFEAGLMVIDPLVLSVKAADIAGERLFVPSDGVRGSGKRVWKIFPVIPEWEGKVQYTVLDETITEDVFADHLSEAGKFIGIGRFRPRNNGFYGRFEVLSIDWK